MPAESPLFNVWAKNRSDTSGDSVRDVRRSRQADRVRATAKWERIQNAAAAEGRPEEGIEAALLAQLGLEQ